MAIQLLSKEQCPFCWQVKIALQYFEIDYELKEWKQPDKGMLLEYSPQGSSPVLLVDDFPIWDSVAIIYYLEDIAPNGNSLFPGNAQERVKARLLHTYNNSIAGKALREVIFEKRSKVESEWDWEQIKQGEQGWSGTLDWLETKIEAEQHFLASGFSIVDAALLPRFGLAEYYGVGVTKNHSKLFNWFQFCKTKELYKKTTFS